MSEKRREWRAVLVLGGFTRTDDLPLLLLPPLLAALWAAQAGLAWAPLLLLLLAVALARAAAWSAFTPVAQRFSELPRERRLWTGVFAAGSLLFALPLGWAALAIPVALGIGALWFALRRRSYLSDSLLAAVPALIAAAAWWGQSAPPSRITGLLCLATFLWAQGALVLSPVQPTAANLAALLAGSRPLAAALLQLAALFALALAGLRANPGLCFWLGLALALLITLLRWRGGGGLPRLAPDRWEALWGAALGAGLLCRLLLR